MSVAGNAKRSKSISSSLFDFQRFPKAEIQTYRFPTKPSQSYNSWTLNNNIHGPGLYTIENDQEKIYYDVMFYANQVEGYGQIFYGNGSHFQGLFKDNRRFGPGVFTYPTGEQDVGFWNGFSIFRLCTSPSSPYIPQLVNSTSGKARILQYRNMVPVCTKFEDVAVEVMKKLKPRDKLMKHCHKLYHVDVKNKDNVFFNKRLYNEYFYESADCTIDVIIENDNVITEAEELLMIKQYNVRMDKLSKRLGLLTITLKEMEEQLNVIRKEIDVVSTQVNYCKECCYENESRKEFEIIEEVKDKDSSIVFEQCQTSSTIESIDLQSFSSNYTKPSEKLEKLTDEYLDQICVCDGEIQIDDLALLETKLQTLTREECFLETIGSNLETKRLAISKSMEETQIRIRKVSVDEIMAWNNDQMTTEMMQHSFLHRRSENMLNFKVSSILSGQRMAFAKEGQHEQDCNFFHTECYFGTTLKVIDYLRRHNINVNMADSKGNSGIFFAVSRNRTDIVKVLANFGANLSQINDEGLTPLNMLILNYLSSTFNVDDWEKAFLPETNLDVDEEKVIKDWQAGLSCFSLGADSSKSYNSLNDYLWNISNRSDKKSKSTMTLSRKRTSYFDNSYRKVDKVKMSDAIRCDKMNRMSLAPKEFMQTVLENTIDTIEMLLKCGADPNIGEVPYPALILSLYSEDANLVLLILEAKADVNVVTPDESLNCLHIVANLSCIEQNIDICNALLDHCCDNNAKTGENHWPELKQRVLGKIDNAVDIPDEGKNPLHILCLREDYITDTCCFFERMATLLIDFKTDLKDRYLGHTPLSLAVLSGNQSLAECLLLCGQIDPYQVLDYNMGNILTLFVLRRYEGILPLNQCTEMLDFLVNLGVNPLMPCDQCENAIEFAENEHTIKVEVAGKNKTKIANLSKNNTLVIIKEHLKSLARKMIIKFVEIEATEHLYDLTEEGLLDKGITKVLAQYLTAEEAIANLQLLFNYGRIKPQRFNTDLMLNTLDFIEANKLEVKKKTVKGKKEKDSATKTSKKSKNDTPEQTLSRRDFFSQTIDDLNFSERTQKRDKKFLLKPGLDNALMYKVCFECLKACNKELTPCPRCHFVFFCSEECNKLNLKSNTGHVCAINVFKTIGQDEDLLEVCRKAHENCVQRYLQEMQKKRDEKIRKEEEDRKMDVYGTKFLRSRSNTINMIDSISVETPSTSPVLHHKHQNRVTLNMDTLLDKTKYIFSFALDEKLQRLSILEEKYRNLIGKRRVSSRGDLKSQKSSVIREERVQQKLPKHTKVDEDVKHKPKPVSVVESKFETLPYFEEPYVTFMRAKKLPKRPQVFIELLGRYFPDFDVNCLTLPYVCHADGHLYYHCKNQDTYTNNYSLL